MEIKRVRHFRTVVDAGGLTRAAGLLHLTPGALSKSIRQLENEIGRKLFHRTARHLQLTEDGTRLYHTSADLLAEHARVLKSLDDSAQVAEQTLRVASFEVFTTHLLAAVMADYAEPLSLRVLELPVRRISEAVADREADLGLTYVPYPQRGLDFKKIGRAEFKIYGRKHSFSRIPFEDLPFAVPTTSIDSSTAGLLGIDGWPYEQINRTIRYELTSLESALALARNGLCVVFLPSFVAAAHNLAVAKRRALTEIIPSRKIPDISHAVYTVMRRESAGETTLTQFSERVANSLIDFTKKNAP